MKDTLGRRFPGAGWCHHSGKRAHQLPSDAFHLLVDRATYATIPLLQPSGLLLNQYKLGCTTQPVFFQKGIFTWLEILIHILQFRDLFIELVLSTTMIDLPILVVHFLQRKIDFLKILNEANILLSFLSVLNDCTDDVHCYLNFSHCPLFNHYHTFKF